GIRGALRPRLPGRSGTGAPPGPRGRGGRWAALASVAAGAAGAVPGDVPVPARLSGNPRVRAGAGLPLLRPRRRHGAEVPGPAHGGRLRRGDVLAGGVAGGPVLVLLPRRAEHQVEPGPPRPPLAPGGLAAQFAPQLGRARGPGPARPQPRLPGADRRAAGVAPRGAGDRRTGGRPRPRLSEPGFTLAQARAGGLRGGGPRLDG